MTNQYIMRLWCVWGNGVLRSYSRHCKCIFLEIQNRLSGNDGDEKGEIRVHL